MCLPLNFLKAIVIYYSPLVIMGTAIFLILNATLLLIDKQNELEFSGEINQMNFIFLVILIIASTFFFFTGLLGLLNVNNQSKPVRNQFISLYYILMIVFLLFFTIFGFYIFYCMNDIENQQQFKENYQKLTIVYEKVDNIMCTPTCICYSEQNFQKNSQNYSLSKTNSRSYQQCSNFELTDSYDYIQYLAWLELAYDCVNWNNSNRNIYLFSDSNNARIKVYNCSESFISHLQFETNLMNTYCIYTSVMLQILVTFLFCLYYHVDNKVKSSGHIIYKRLGYLD